MERRAHLQALWINIGDWVSSNRCIGVNPAPEAYEITLNIPPHGWVIVSKIVLM
jgi:hypothetical protein